MTHRRILIPTAASLIVAAIGLAQPAAAQQATSPTDSTHKRQQRHARHETQADLEQQAKISMDSAKVIALAQAPGASVKLGELEREHGKLIYSFDLSVPSTSGVEEVNVDAMSGKLIGKHHESAKAEAKEAKSEAKAKP